MESTAVRRRAEVEMTLSIDDAPDRAVEAARLWVQSAFERFTGDLGAFVRNAAAEEVEWMNTTPAHVRACVTVSFRAAGERLETYSEAGLRLLLDDIRHVPQYAAVEALTNTHEGGGVCRNSRSA